MTAKQVFAMLKTWVQSYVIPTTAIQYPITRSGLTTDVQNTLTKADNEPALRDDGLATKVDKVTGNTTHPQAYIKESNGTQTTKDIVTSPVIGSIPTYGSANTLKTATPVVNDDAANKYYIDSEIDTLENQLEQKINDIDIDPADLISSDADNIIELGSDNKLHAISNSPKFIVIPNGSDFNAIIEPGTYRGINIASWLTMLNRPDVAYNTTLGYWFNLQVSLASDGIIVQRIEMVHPDDPNVIYERASQNAAGTVWDSFDIGVMRPYFETRMLKVRDSRTTPPVIQTANIADIMIGATVSAIDFVGGYDLPQGGAGNVGQMLHIILEGVTNGVRVHIWQLFEQSLITRLYRQTDGQPNKILIATKTVVPGTVWSGTTLLDMQAMVGEQFATVIQNDFYLSTGTLATTGQVEYLQAGQQFEGIADIDKAVIRDLTVPIGSNSFAQTMPEGDNSNRLATTAYADRAAKNASVQDIEYTDLMLLTPQDRAGKTFTVKNDPVDGDILNHDLSTQSFGSLFEILQAVNFRTGFYNISTVGLSDILPASFKNANARLFIEPRRNASTSCDIFLSLGHGHNYLQIGAYFNITTGVFTGPWKYLRGYKDSPHLWESGIEYSFGDGSFGQRFTGKITAPASTNVSIVLITTGIATGKPVWGWWDIGTGTKAIVENTGIKGGTTDIGWTSNVYTNAATELRMSSYTNGVNRDGVTNSDYDVCVIYTKV